MVLNFNYQLVIKPHYPYILTHFQQNNSTKGYGTAMYLRTEYPSSHVDVTFVIGKSRVAPVKFVSIHRLELQAAQLGSRLAVGTTRYWHWLRNFLVEFSDSPLLAEFQNHEVPCLRRHPFGRHFGCSVGFSMAVRGYRWQSRPRSLGQWFFYFVELRLFIAPFTLIFPYPRKA